MADEVKAECTQPNEENNKIKGENLNVEDHMDIHITETNLYTAEQDNDSNEIITTETVGSTLDIEKQKKISTENEPENLEILSMQQTDTKISEEQTPDVSEPNSKQDSGENSANETPPSKKKQKGQLMSESFERLTAKKGESPVNKRRTATSEECKARADDLRRKKIASSRSKDDDRRAAVLERKKKLEDANREKKEALYKKIAAEKPKTNPAEIRKKYSVSTSNLSQLRKHKAVEKDIDIGETERPKSSMQRTRPSSSTSNLLRSKDKLQKDSVTKSSLQTKESARNFSRPSLNPRPATALGISANRDRRKTTQSNSSTSTKVLKSTTTEKKPSQRPLSSTSHTVKSKSDSASPLKSTQTANFKSKSESASPKDRSAPKKITQTLAKPKIEAGTKTITKTKTTTAIEKTTTSVDGKPAKPTGAGKATKKPAVKLAKTSKDIAKSPTATKPVKSPTGSRKTTQKESTHATEISPKSLSTKAPSLPSSNSTKKTSANSKTAKTEEEAKKALAERRKKAKEEAEAKAKAEKEKDEEECRKRDEEEKRLAAQLKEEEERQSALLEQLHVEEEERRKKMKEEKEKREKEEKERLENEQRLRDEEIERKAKLELEKRQKEQEEKELELDAERTERKKRVEMIMARVAAKRSTGGSESSISIPTLDNAGPAEDSPESASARLKVDGILQRLGHSNENLEELQDSKSGNSTDIADASSQCENKDLSPESRSLNEDNVELESHSIDNDTKLEMKYESENENGNQDDKPDLESQSVNENFSNAHSVLVNEDNGDSKLKLDANPLLENKTESIPELSAVDVEEPAVSPEEEVPIQRTPVEDIASYLIASSDSIPDENKNTLDGPFKPDFKSEEASKINFVCNNDEKLDDMKTENVSDKNVINDIDKVNGHNGNLNEKVENGSNNNTLLLTNGDSCAVAVEEEQWKNLENNMKDLQIQQSTPSAEESKLWKVVEGTVDISECF